MALFNVQFSFRENPPSHVPFTVCTVGDKAGLSASQHVVWDASFAAVQTTENLWFKLGHSLNSLKIKMVLNKTRNQKT